MNYSNMNLKELTRKGGVIDVEKADSKFLWKFFYALPRISCATYNFFDEDSNSAIEQVNIWKGEQNYYPSEPRYIDESRGRHNLYDAIGRYGLTPYKLHIVVNHGFGGASAVINVYRHKTIESRALERSEQNVLDE